jgi:penicillin-binding protein-related factor A (putative recombinase)
MRATNRGKDFEKNIKECLCHIKDVSFDRLPDPMAGYSGVRNICDFSMFHSPDMFYLECKSHYGNTLNYASDITENQWNGMLEKSRLYRCVAGVCVWFIDHDITVFVNILDLENHRKSGAKSLNIIDITGENSVPHFIIDGIKKKVMFKYFGESFLRNLHKQADKIWGEINSEN